MAIYTVELYRSDTLVMEMIAVAVCVTTILLLLMVTVMALHGLNLSFAFTGQEEIWSRVWNRVRLHQQEYDISSNFIFLQKNGINQNYRFPIK